jgi:hypothetical protein
MTGSGRIDRMEDMQFTTEFTEDTERKMTNDQASMPDPFGTKTPPVIATVHGRDRNAESAVG